MASCPKCNSEVSEGAQICVHCGAKFDAPNSSEPTNSNNKSTSGAVDNENNNNSGDFNPAGLDNEAPAAPRSLSTSFKSTLKPQMKPPMAERGSSDSSDSTPDMETGMKSGFLAQPPGPSTPETGASGDASSSRSKWLEEQDKIKHELEALKGKITTDFKIDTDLDLKDGDDIFQLDDMEMEHIKDASISLTPLKRPLTEEEEEKKQELLSEIKDLKAEGYDTNRLERIVEVDPTSAWQEFVEYMDDIDTLTKLRKRYSELDTTGFEEESESIKSKLDNPDLIHQIERELNDLENKISMGATESDQGGLRELIDAGKEAFKNNEFQKALNFYKSALKIDPNNREVEFYRKKTEAKLQALTGAKATSEPVSAAPASKPAYTPASGSAPPYAPAPTPPAPTVEGRIAISRKMKVRPKGAPGAPAPVAAEAAPRAPIPTGGNVEVKTPLSVSMTPKLPADRQIPRPAGRKVPLVKPKRVSVKKPLPTATPPASPAPAMAKQASNNPAEVEALGFNAFINKDFEKALDYYEQVLALDPNFPGAAAQRDKCLEALGRI